LHFCVILVLFLNQKIYRLRRRRRRRHHHHNYVTEVSFFPFNSGVGCNLLQCECNVYPRKILEEVTKYFKWLFEKAV
jgi:hypothetical protein